MSRQEGVSCDSCLKTNFRGRRYKCLICYDYDLCASCYEDGAISTRHSVDHPMQCILTRLDFELFYGGEVLIADQPQSFTCPYCKRMGFSETSLYEHVGAEHTDTGVEVVCPVCAALPGGDPNLVTDDFAGHLTLEHRTGSRDLISFLDEPSAIRHGGVRRMPHTNRALGGPRSRRSNMQFSQSNHAGLSPPGRDSVDPIAELLSQLSGVRRGNPQPSQLQQFQMQIQLERQQQGRQQLERLPRRQVPVAYINMPTVNAASLSTSNTMATSSMPITSGISISSVASLSNRDAFPSTHILTPIATAAGNNIATAAAAASGQGGGASASASPYLLARFIAPVLDESDLAQMERDRAANAQAVQALLLSTLSIHAHEDDTDGGDGGASCQDQQSPAEGVTGREGGGDVAGGGDEADPNSSGRLARMYRNNQQSDGEEAIADGRDTRLSSSAVSIQHQAMGKSSGKGKPSGKQQLQADITAGGGGGGGVGGGGGGGGAHNERCGRPPAAPASVKSSEMKSQSSTPVSSKTVTDTR